MRVSVWKNDAGYANFGVGGWEVKLDGEVMQRVFVADEDRGEVIRAKVVDGQVQVEDGEIVTETVTGKVELSRI